MLLRGLKPWSIPLLLGDDAGYGSENSFHKNDIFIGQGAGRNNVQGWDNIYIGTNAGKGLRGGRTNVVMGTNAAAGARIMNRTVAIGEEAGYGSDDPTGTQLDVFVGYRAGYSNSSGGYNVFVGASAGSGNTTGEYNVAVGNGSGASNIAGSDNVFVGSLAGQYIKEYKSSVVIGSQAGACTFEGASTATGNTGGAVFIGQQAGYNNTNGHNNVFIGRKSGYSNTQSISNVFIGQNSGYNTNGKTSRRYEDPITGTYFYETLGSANVFLGQSSGYKNTTGYHNVYIGTNAGFQNETGKNNVFIGYNAGLKETGSDLLYISNSETEKPLIYGDFADSLLRVNGQLNVTKEIRTSGLVWAKGLVTEGDMVLGGSVIPSRSVTYDLGSENNRWRALYTKDINARRLTISSSSYLYSVDVTNSQSTSGVVAAVHGKSTAGTASCYGLYGEARSTNSNAHNHGITGEASGGAIAIGVYGYAEGGASRYAAWFGGDVMSTTGVYANSDSRLKKNVETIDGALDKVLKLRGVTYYWKNREEMAAAKGVSADSMRYGYDDKKHIGVIAQEMEEVFPELVGTDPDGFKSVSYSNLTPILIEAVKELKAEKDELQTTVTSQQAKIDNQQQQIDELKRMVEELMKKQ